MTKIPVFAAPHVLQSQAAKPSGARPRQASRNGIAKDEVEAYKWFLRAAAQGDPQAKNQATFF